MFESFKQVSIAADDAHSLIGAALVGYATVTGSTIFSTWIFSTMLLICWPVGELVGRTLKPDALDRLPPVPPSEQNFEPRKSGKGFEFALPDWLLALCYLTVLDGRGIADPGPIVGGVPALRAAARAWFQTPGDSGTWKGVLPAIWEAAQ
jgi:hypothetical protein